jgi:anti-sigma B factor antagonist
MEIATRNEHGLTIVKVTGRLDAVTGQEFDQKAAEWTDLPNSRIIIDFSQLEYISSYGLRSLLSLTKALHDSCGTIAIAGINGLVEEVIQVSGFDTIIPVYDDVESAIAGVS